MKAMQRRFPIGKIIEAINPITSETEKCEVVGWWSEGMRGSENYDCGPRGIFNETTDAKWANSSLAVKQRESTHIAMWTINQ